MSAHVLAVLAALSLFAPAAAVRAADCPSSVVLQMAPTGCRRGSAVVAVDPIAGATYSWTIEGGALVSGAGTERILIATGSGQVLRVTVLVASACGTQSASGIMALREPFGVQSLDVTGGTHAGQPRTLTWSYQNGEPVTQVLTGSDFPQPIVLSATTRSYTYTPTMYGDKSVVLDASITPPPVRARAAGRGGAVASSCSSARAEARFHVDCNTPVAAIVAPAATGVGLPFTASVELPAGTTATWTIANGLPATASGASVSIKPTGAAPVDIHVTVAADTCTATAAAQVRVDSVLGCEVVPQAELTLGASDCDKGVISVRLTGTPPFSGTWSDGVPFAADGVTAERTITDAGTYTIRDFRDAFCPGQAGALQFAPKPTVTVAAGNSSCTTTDASAVLTFTGTPPFLGEWSDGVVFNTTEPRLERKINTTTDLTLKWFRDAKCDGVITGHASFGGPGTANVRLVSPLNGCVAYGVGGQPARVAVDLTGAPPFTVKWSDGAEQTVNASPLVRDFTPPVNTVSALTLLSAHDAHCDLPILNSTVSVTTTTAPQMTAADQVPLCPGHAATVSLQKPVTPQSTITWSIDHGSIVSGQGTSKVSFTVPSGEPSATLSVQVNDPSTCPATSSMTMSIAQPAAQVQLAVDRTTIQLGETLTFTLTLDPSRNNGAALQLTSPGFEQFAYVYDARNTIRYTPKVKGTLTFTAAGPAMCPFLPATYAYVTVTVQ